MPKNCGKNKKMRDQSVADFPTKIAFLVALDQSFQVERVSKTFHI